MKIELSPFGIVEKIRSGDLKLPPNDVDEEEIVKQAADEIRSLFLERVHRVARQLMAEIPDGSLMNFPMMESVFLALATFIRNRVDERTLP